MSICRERFRTTIKIGLGVLLITSAAASAQNGFKAVPLPNPGIPGYNFPETEDTIHQWVRANNQHEINLHAWGIWTALTTDSGETFDGQKLLVFETWHTPEDIIAGVKTDDSNRQSPRPVGALNQFTRHTGVAAEGEATVLGFVKYDPTATEHIIKNNLFSKAALNAMIKAGKTAIPNFPYRAIALKPVHQAIAQKDLENGYYKLPVWPGPYGSPPFPGTAVPYAYGEWPHHVWVDVQGDGSKNASVVKLSDFIHFKLTEAEAQLINKEGEKILGGISTKNPLTKGDYAILLAMHVTSREITRWTWQTFWWTPTPDAPHFPSSAAIAKDRPSQLKGAAKNYAHAPAYSMKYPPQPINGGKNVGNSVYAYNPWLEAGFDFTVLPDSKLGTYDGRLVPNNVGTQSNCMSCHGSANYNPRNISEAPRYTGDRYVDQNDPRFKGTLKVDFLWSIPSNVQPQDNSP
ncbi:MAG: hypothetical protein O7G83_03350 [Proteobacteria bacterium]|nr:hypothetical protein [Pseudomonadota bacterium]